MNNDIIIRKLSENPLIAYSISLPSPQELKLSEYEERSFPAIIGNLTGLSVSKVQPMYKLGRVFSFDVFPRSNPDPILIYSPIGDLKSYYEIWSDILVNGLGLFPNRKIKKYDQSISKFLLSLTGNQLSKEEIIFAVIEMLKFKNDIILR